MYGSSLDSDLNRLGCKRQLWNNWRNFNLNRFGDDIWELFICRIQQFMIVQEDAEIFRGKYRVYNFIFKWFSKKYMYIQIKKYKMLFVGHRWWVHEYSLYCFMKFFIVKNLNIKHHFIQIPCLSPVHPCGTLNLSIV